MVIALILLVLAILAGVMILFWHSLTSTEKAALLEALAENSYTLLALITLLALPVSLLAPMPAWMPHWGISIAVLFLWGIFLAYYWDQKVLPLSALIATPTAPLLPGLAPLRVTELPLVLDGDVLKSYRWLFTPRDGLPVEMVVEVSISTERYQAARAEARRQDGDWAHYATTDMPELDTMAACFHRLHLRRQWPTLEQASNVLNFTQACIRYELDETTTPAVEWPRYPIETLMDECGDCEDDVILAAAILKRLGFEVALLYYPGHCALGLAGADGLPGEYVTDRYTGLKYFYGETTAKGWRLGEVPEPYRGRKPNQIELVHHVVKN